jgi:drug/metabolite transporter (DMT)-like permease
MATTRPFPAPRLAIAPPSRRTLAVLALVGANAIWGGSVVASEAALAHLPPLTLACVRVAVAVAVLEFLLARSGARPARGRAPALLGLTGVALFCACQNLGLRFADATTAALLGGAIPVLTTLQAVPILGERVQGRRLAGLLVSLAGVAVVVLLGPGASLGASTLANLLPLASAASFAAYAVLGRRVFGARGAGTPSTCVGASLAVVAGSTRYGLLFLLPGALVELATKEVGPLTARDGLLLLYLGAGCSALAFVLMGYGLAHLEAGQGATFGNLKPLVGVILAVALLGESVTSGQVGGGVLVLLGVSLAGRSRPRSVCRRPGRPGLKARADPTKPLRG